MTRMLEIDAFMDYLRFERNRSPRTVGEYEMDLEAFEQYFKSLDATLTFDTVDTDVIRGWMEDMMDRGNRATSICRRLSAVKSLYRFGLSRGLVNHDPAHAIHAPKKHSVALARDPTLKAQIVHKSVYRKSTGGCHSLWARKTWIACSTMWSGAIHIRIRARVPY